MAVRVRKERAKFHVSYLRIVRTYEKEKNHSGSTKREMFMTAYLVVPLE